jgi:hypothetical protein
MASAAVPDLILPPAPPGPLPTCTLQVTGRQFVRQRVGRCKTCYPEPGSCICEVCAYTCHVGHDVELEPYPAGSAPVPTGMSSGLAHGAYCDCGEGGSCHALRLDHGPIPEQFCSYERSGPHFIPQAIFTCQQCSFTGSKIMCYGCAVTCHAGHTGVKFTRMSQSAYCDCAKARCCKLFPTGRADPTPGTLSAPAPAPTSTPVVRTTSTSSTSAARTTRREPEVDISNALFGNAPDDFADFRRHVRGAQEREHSDAVPSGDVCTYSVHGDKGITMKAFHCYTCATVGGDSICQACSVRCHTGHKVVAVGVTRDTTCACGANDSCIPCKSLKKALEGSSDPKSTPKRADSTPAAATRPDTSSDWLFAGAADPGDPVEDIFPTRSLASPPLASPQPAANPAAPKEEENSCIICFDAPQNTVLVPCGHVPACWDCSLQIHAGKAGGSAAARGRPFCPVCRAKVTAVIRLYKV